MKQVEAEVLLRLLFYLPLCSHLVQKVLLEIVFEANFVCYQPGI